MKSTHQARSHVRHLLSGLVLTTFLAAGCKMKVMQPTSDDQVRERIASLKAENQSLEEANSGLQARIDELTREQSPQLQSLGAATPRLSSLRIASSSVVEASKDEVDGSTLVLRLASRDDRGRFLQIVGGLDVRAVSVPDTGDPVLLASLEFDPLDVRDAWRGGVIGSGYVFEVPIPVASSDLPATIDVVTIFTEGGSDRTLRDEAPVPVSGNGRS